MASAFVAAFEILSFGAIIVLVVLGLGIIASMMGIFNFAQGEFVLLGAYITYLAYSHGLPIWVGMITAPILVGALGFVRLEIGVNIAPAFPGRGVKRGGRAAPISQHRDRKTPHALSQPRASSGGSPVRRLVQKIGAQNRPRKCAKAGLWLRAASLRHSAG